MLALEYKQLNDIMLPGMETTRMQACPDHIILVGIHEGLEITVAGRAAGRIAAGELVYIPPRCEVAIVNAHPLSASLILLQFDCREGDRQVPLLEDHQLGDRHWVAFRMPQAHLWLDDFRQPSDELILFLKQQSRLYTLAAACLEHVQVKQHVAAPDLHLYMDQIKQDILENYSAPIDIEQLAQQSGWSASRFYQLFRSHVGLSPHKFITAVRLTASLPLLNSGALSITETAHAVGYQDEYYFSRLFKKSMGMSPSDYMVQSCMRVVNLSPAYTADLKILGVNPVLTLEHDGSMIQDESLEAMRAGKPDVILASPLSAAWTDRLTNIAPVEMLYGIEQSWRERLKQISQVLGLASVADYWLFVFDQAEAAWFYMQEQFVGGS